MQRWQISFTKEKFVIARNLKFYRLINHHGFDPAGCCAGTPVDTVLFVRVGDANDGAVLWLTMVAEELWIGLDTEELTGIFAVLFVETGVGEAVFE